MMAGPAEIGFSKWLADLGTQFRKLSEDQRNHVLDHLIDQSSSIQLHHLSDKLPLLVKRDFIRLLPLELVECLLRFFDDLTLLRCCAVSHTWNNVINQCDRAWRRAAIVAGASLKQVNKCCGNPIKENTATPHEKAQCYKAIYLRTVRKLKEIRSDQTFSRVILKGHQSRIMAVYYKNGKVATGCDDHTVRLWDVTTGKCLLKLLTNSVSDVKFDDRFIVTASFDNTAACWDVNSGSRVQTYVGHIAAIFTVDFDVVRDLVATGAADRVIILWQLSSGELLHSIAGHHTSWVMKVRLLPRTDAFLPNSIPPLTPDCDTIPSELPETIKLISACSNTAFNWTVLKDDQGYRVTEVKTVHTPPENFCLHQSFDMRNNVSSFYLSDRNAREGYLYCTPLNQDMNSTRQTSQLIHLNGNHDVFLGIGKRFAVFVDFQDTDTMKIVDLVKKETIAQHYLPPCRPSRNGSTFTLGTCEWLDGIGEKADGLLLAACLKSNDVILLKWKDR